MSLISQNVSSKMSSKKSKKDVIEEETLLDGNVKGVEEDSSALDVMRTKKRKKQRKEEEDEKLFADQQIEMKKLEDILFGSLYSPVEFGKDFAGDFLNAPANDTPLFIMDRSANNVISIYANNDSFQEGSDGQEQIWQRKRVWVDEEEETTNVNIAKVNRLRKLRKEEDEKMVTGSEYVSRLRAQHAKLNRGTEWAQLDLQSNNGIYDGSSDEENGRVICGYDNGEAIDDILRTNEDLVIKNNVKLFPGLLEHSRLIDANSEEPSDGPINSVQFHQNAQLLLTAGLDRRIRFFQVDGKRNTKIQSIFLDDCPIRKASFIPDGSQVIISGRRKFFYSFDLMKASVDKIGPLVGREEKSLENFEVSPDSRTIAVVGNEGYILLVSTKTKELIGTLKMNGTARSLAFTQNGEQLLSSGGDGMIYHWDLRTMTCFHKGIDEGCINGTSICTTPNGTLFAAGSDSGIVNIYNREEFLGGKRKPIKVIENLTTKVDFMKFNSDSQILALGSSMKKNSLKLIHIPSFTVFSNWPPPKQILHYPRCLDFSPGGGFMAMGNAAGKVLLYKLHHYHHA